MRQVLLPHLASVRDALSSCSRQSMREAQRGRATHLRSQKHKMERWRLTARAEDLRDCVPLKDSMLNPAPHGATGELLRP